MKIPKKAANINSPFGDEVLFSVFFNLDTLVQELRVRKQFAAHGARKSGANKNGAHPITNLYRWSVAMLQAASHEKN
jgi:hypothetical protein